jgi:hypothetical protein
MNTPLRVSLNPSPRRPVPQSRAEPLLERGGAAVIVGATPTSSSEIATPVVAAATTLFAPRSACVSADGNLWVADTGHHRLLGWKGLPGEDGAAAEVLVGQPHFAHEGRNALGPPGAATCNVPTGVTACGSGLALADSWNHRVLIWYEPPRKRNQPADLVLGQNAFDSVEPNGGLAQPGANTMFWPFGVAWDGKNLWVADTGNRRVLIWNGLPPHPGAAADLVLGQSDFSCRDENGGFNPSNRSMRWPHGISFPGGGTCIADAGNNRLMIWQRAPTKNGQECDVILGQVRADLVDHNQSDYWPSAAALNMPYAVTTIGAWLVAADTANSRLLAWPETALRNGGMAASRLAGQPQWDAKGDNRWKPPARDSLCWPYGLASDGTFAIIADAGNNRVLLWRWDEGVVR